MSHNRPRTEAQFLAAVTRHLKEHGFAGLGVNAIADQAGYDKVLIYRYFRNLDGLLERLASDQEFFPDHAAIVAELPWSSGGTQPLPEAVAALLGATLPACLSNPLSQAIIRWEGAAPDNPLTRAWRAGRSRCAGILRRCCEPAAGSSIPSTAWFEAILSASLRSAVIEGVQNPAAAFTTRVDGISVRLQGNDRPEHTSDPDELPVELL